MAEAKAILVPDYLTVRELAELIEASPIDVMNTGSINKYDLCFICGMNA